MEPVGVEGCDAIDDRAGATKAGTVRVAILGRLLLLVQIFEDARVHAEEPISFVREVHKSFTVRPLVEIELGFNLIVLPLVFLIIRREELFAVVVVVRALL